MDAAARFGDCIGQSLVCGVRLVYVMDALHRNGMVQQRNNNSDDHGMVVYEQQHGGVSMDVSTMVGAAMDSCLNMAMDNMARRNNATTDGQLQMTDGEMNSTSR
jgi:hypothetical protein